MTKAPFLYKWLFIIEVIAYVMPARLYIPVSASVLDFSIRFCLAGEDKAYDYAYG